MKFSSPLLGSLLLAPAVFAQSSASPAPSGSSAPAPSASASGAAGNGTDGAAYLQAVLGALNANNLTALAGIATTLAGTPEGQALFTQLSQGNKTVFAPSDEAFSAVPEEVSSNTTLLGQILSYHILNNSYTPSGVQVAPNHTIARTLLQGGEFSLAGNRSAPLVLARNDTNGTTFQILQTQNNISVTGPVAAANLQVYIIDQVLQLPQNLTTVATELLPQLATIVQSAELLGPLEQSESITVFAPNDAALGAVQDTLASLNQTQIQSVLANHVINGTAAYSSLLGTGNFTSAGGQPFTFMSNSSGTYVMSGQASAQVVQSDIIIQNGVVHIINGVLANTESNPQAAESAFSSATAGAATQTEPTTPVTNTSPAATGTGASGSPTGAAGRLEPFTIGGGVIGSILAVGAAVVGGAMVLA